MIRHCAACVAVMLASGSAARGQTTAATVVGSGVQANSFLATGWWFNTTADVTIDQLGVWDEHGNGLSSPHQVGIFVRSTLAPVVTAIVPSGTAAPLIDGSRFVGIQPVTLSAGVTYYILANNWVFDRVTFGSGAVAFAPPVNWLGNCDASSNSIETTPTFYMQQPGNLGPNFRMVPAPGGLAVLGAAGCLAARRRRPGPPAAGLSPR
jgi:hypothetical protein